MSLGPWTLTVGIVPVKEVTVVVAVFIPVVVAVVEELVRGITIETVVVAGLFPAICDTGAPLTCCIARAAGDVAVVGTVAGVGVACVFSVVGVICDSAAVVVGGVKLQSDFEVSGCFETGFSGCWCAAAPFGGGVGDGETAFAASLAVLVELVSLSGADVTESSSLRGLLFLCALSGEESSNSLRFLRKLLILCWE